MTGKWSNDKYRVKVNFADVVNGDMTIMLTIIAVIDKIIREDHSFSGLVNYEEEWSQLTEIPFPSDVAPEDRQNIILDDLKKTFEHLVEYECDESVENSILDELSNFDRDSEEYKENYKKWLDSIEFKNEELRKLRKEAFNKLAKAYELLNM